MKLQRTPLIILAALAAALLLPPAWAQQDNGDAITAADGRGNVATVYNLFDGNRYGIQISHMAGNGYVQWTQQHSDGLVEKATSAVMDGDSEVFVAGVRRQGPRRYMLLLKYDANGWFTQEWADSDYDCTATAMGVDPAGNVTLAGGCKYSDTSSPARLLHFNNNGQLLWSQNYDGGGRNYVRGLTVDVQGNIMLTVETAAGNYSNGSYGTHVIVFNESGQRIEVR